MTEGSFPSLAETLLGEPVVCQNMQFFNKPPGNGQPTPPHQDGFYFKLDPPNALTMWMTLEPVGAPDNLVWSADGMIYVQEDGDGQGMFQMNSDGSGLLQSLWFNRLSACPAAMDPAGRARLLAKTGCFIQKGT